MPDPPGPPGFTNSDPILRAGSRAGNRASRNLILRPPGRL